MDPEEVVILCGEWETGPTPQNFSDEKHCGYHSINLKWKGGGDVSLILWGNWSLLPVHKSSPLIGERPL